MPRGYKEENWGNRICPVRESEARIFLLGAGVKRGLDPGIRGIYIVRLRHQETASGNCNKFEILVFMHQ
jgi:hypothetical protein